MAYEIVYGVIYLSLFSAVSLPSRLVFLIHVINATLRAAFDFIGNKSIIGEKVPSFKALQGCDNK